MPSSSHVNRKVFFCGAESMLPYSQKLSKLSSSQPVNLIILTLSHKRKPNSLYFPSVRPDIGK